MKKSGNKIDVLSFVHEVILLSYKDFSRYRRFQGTFCIMGQQLNVYNEISEFSDGKRE